jgi:hypothetical protein
MIEGEDNGEIGVNAFDAFGCGLGRLNYFIGDAGGPGAGLKQLRTPRMAHLP